MKKIVQEAGLEDAFYISSAATSAEELFKPVYPPMKRLLTEQGIDCENKRARRMTREDYAAYDFLIGMDYANIGNMKRVCGGDPQGKIFLLTDFTSKKGEVADPWYTGDFLTTWIDVNEGCRGLLSYLRAHNLLGKK